jgi:hypothetical protein
MIYARFAALRKEREVLFFTNVVLRNEIRADNELAAALLMALFDNASPSDLRHFGNARSETQLLLPRRSNYDEEDA